MRVAVFLILLIALVAAPAAAAEAADPGEDCRLYGVGCKVEASLTNDSAILNGTQPGAPGGSGATGNNANTGNNSNASTDSSTAPTTPAASCAFWGTVGSDLCRAFAAATMPVPTLNDIAAFRPTPGVDHMEPNGWFVVGLDANFYATGGASVVDGTLLGYPASVRFTPIRWSWAYGDGATATKSTRGATWQAQGIAEFDPTSTSHVYSQAGTYFIDLTIGYRVEYSFNGSSWAPISGTLWLPANRLVATVGDAKTVLVERDCTVNPAGPGCFN